MLSFLQSLGAIASEGDNCAFPGEITVLSNFDNHDMIVPLSQYGLLEVRGPEAEKFLQGQITCSSAEVTSAMSSPGAYCTPKGRVITSFQLLRPQSDLFWLRMRSDLLDIAARTFGKYIVFSKAKLAAVESAVGIGFHGNTIATVLREVIGGSLPDRQNATVSYTEGLLLQRDADGTHFEYWGPLDSATKLWSQCTGRVTPVGSAYWRWLQIRSGNAEICAATSEIFLPHMLNYHETGAINFKKGCYTGQEIVARTHYRGQVKRHLLRAELSGPAPLPGSEIMTAAAKAVGNVVDSVVINSTTAELLAVVADESIETSTVLHSNTAELRALTLPYAIP